MTAVNVRKLLDGARSAARSWSDTEHIERAIATSPLGEFAVPHFIADDILPPHLAAAINENWPRHELFHPEVKGNYLFTVSRHSYNLLPEPQRRFWANFNETIWPVVAAAAAEAFEAPAVEVFGDLYHRHLTFDMPLTLMHADPTYAGHGMHSHFYHCPYWAFTMLLYVDADDTVSRGTALHRLEPRTDVRSSLTTYLTGDLDWRAEVAMDTLHWRDNDYTDRSYAGHVSAYKANRLFSFMDGPLSFHSVPLDNADHSPDPRRAQNGGRDARRRVLRSHIKVDKAAFYEGHSARLAALLDPARYERIMAPDVVLSPDDQRYREDVIRPFFQERLSAYARAAALARMPLPLRHRFTRYSASAHGRVLPRLLASIH